VNGCLEAILGRPGGYARGCRVNQVIEQHRDHICRSRFPAGIQTQPWRAADTLTSTATCIAPHKCVGKRIRPAAIRRKHAVGPGSAKDLFSVEAAMAHFVIGDHNVPNDGFQGGTRVQTDPDDDEDDPEPIESSGRS